MSFALPFLTAYDPPGESEGTLDALGLYTIADQLAVQLVPAIRERMLRIRFLTTMTVGACLAEKFQLHELGATVNPMFVWEWLVVESFVRYGGPRNGKVERGVPGIQVAQRAISQRDYLDARSYLKTPSVFGFHGVYKRLAMRLGLVDVHLAPGPNAGKLMDAWTRDNRSRGVDDQLLTAWGAGIIRALQHRPPRTDSLRKPPDPWMALAETLAPSNIRQHERRCLRNLLLHPGHNLGAVPHLWGLMENWSSTETDERALHQQLVRVAPEYQSLCTAIEAYESFARPLQDAFDWLRFAAAAADARGYAISTIRHEPEFNQCVAQLHQRFNAAHHALSDVSMSVRGLHHEFVHRFGLFAEPMEPVDCAIALLSHHDQIQRGKSATGKRAWFDRLSHDRVHIRQAFRIPRPDSPSNRFLHLYRAFPLRRFYRDLTPR